jgi:hypothetical protein
VPRDARARQRLVAGCGRTEQYRCRARREISVNVCRGAAMFNANVVNGDSGVLKLHVFWQKNAVWGRFLALKNTVNYSSRFELTIRFTVC